MLKIIIILFFCTQLFASVFSPNLNLSYLQIKDSAPHNPDANIEAIKINGDAITIEAWLYLTDYSLYNASRDRFYPILGRYYNYYLALKKSSNSNGFELCFILWHASNESDTLFLAQVLNTNTWNHVAATYDGNAMRLYINGQLAAEKGNTKPIVDSGRYIKMRIDGTLIYDLRLWNLCRSESEIKSTFSTELTGQENGLVGYWPLTEQINGVTPDKTSNHNDFEIYIRPIENANPLYFSSATPSVSLSVGNSMISVVPSTLDYGEVEKDTYSSQEIKIINTGNKYVYGKINLRDTLSVDGIQHDAIFFVDPMDTLNHVIAVRPKIKGTIINSFLFNEGTFNNTNLSLPFSIQCLRENGIDVNNIDLWVLNDGRLGYNLGYGPGLEWPKNYNKYLGYGTFIWLGAEINGQICSSVSNYKTQFVPGNIVNGIPAKVDDEEFHVYKIHIGDDNSNPDYANWPVDLGAPTNPDGSPKHMGDQTLFAVFNDQDSAAHDIYSNTTPLGAEIQQTIWGWDDSDEMANSVFLKFKIVNRSQTPWEKTYFALEVDPDIGYYGDDLVGVDSSRNMAFAYNGENIDNIYGEAPPAIGYKILKGAFYSRPIHSFIYYGNTSPWVRCGIPRNSQEFYNYLQGLSCDGQSYINPNNGENTKFPLAGDPETQNGWIDSNPAERKFLISTGPFNLAPEESKEIVIAIIVAQGNNNLNSVTVLKQTADIIQQKYDNGEILGGAVESVAIKEIAPSSQDTINDVSNSGTELQVTAGEGGATIELVSYEAPPTSAPNLESSAIHGVGSYLDVQSSGDIKWPVKIKVYYTREELNNANISESEVRGLYYWNATKDKWILFSESGIDDQGRGVSKTGVDTSNLAIEGIEFEGFVWGELYHLTPICIGSVIDSSLVDINTDMNILPQKYLLLQNYPNPFNSFTTIKYKIPTTGKVEINIYDLNGQLVRNYVNLNQSIGWHKIIWEGRNDAGESVASGIYIYRLKFNHSVLTNKMILLK